MFRADVPDPVKSLICLLASRSKIKSKWCLPCDIDLVTALHCGGCSNRNELFFHAKCLKIKTMFGMLGSRENLCGWLFIMELLPLGYHCIRT